jgi:hypothetical protein
MPSPFPKKAITSTPFIYQLMLTTPQLLFSYAAGCSAGLRKDKPGLDFVPKNAELPDKSSVDVPYVDKHAFERKHRLKT